MPGDTPDCRANPLVRGGDGHALCAGGIEVFDSAHVCGAEAPAEKDHFELNDNPTCEPA